MFDTDQALIKEKRADDTMRWYECLSLLTKYATEHLDATEEEVIMYWRQYIDCHRQLIACGDLVKQDLALGAEMLPNETVHRDERGRFASFLSIHID